MPIILFYFDFILPQAYMAFYRLPRVLAGMAWHIRYCPVSLADLAKHEGRPLQLEQGNNAEHMQQLAQHNGLPFTVPNPALLAQDASQTWLHMALASAPEQGHPGRWVCETIFNALWQSCPSETTSSVEKFQQDIWRNTSALLPFIRDPYSEEVQQQLDKLNLSAQQHALTKLPACVLLPGTSHGQAELFCGLDALPNLRSAVAARQIQSKNGLC